MANHELDPQKEQRRHIGPIVGIIVALAVAAIAMFFYSGTREVEDDVLRETDAPASAVSTVTSDDVTTDASQAGEVTVERVTD